MMTHDQFCEALKRVPEQALARMASDCQAHALTSTDEGTWHLREVAVRAEIDRRKNERFHSIEAGSDYLNRQRRSLKEIER